MYLEKLFGLKGKVAVVTGGGRGIGQTVACGLAKAGAEVAILCRSEASKTIEMIEKEGGSAYWISTDVTKESQVENAFSGIMKQSGSIDVVFNNAGICKHRDTFDTSMSDFQEVMDVNVTGPFNVARIAAKMMVDKGIAGNIVNMASMSGYIVNIPQAQCSYNTSKAAVRHMTKSLAVEWAQKNIRVNSISPGYVSTPMASDTPQELRDVWTDIIPMKRFADPEELMTAILYLVSDASSYTTGSDVVVDGAYTCI